MQMWLKDDEGNLIATMVNGNVYPAPGVDREFIAFQLFKATMSLLSPGVPSVTWAQAWMSGKMGTPTSPGG